MPRPASRSPCLTRIADGRTTVPLHLEPWGTVFVVFRTPTKENARTLPKVTETELATVDGPWKVSFQPGSRSTGLHYAGQAASWSDNRTPE
jgi:hypothetical protein